MILACDPGLTGAFAFYGGASLKVLPMPTITATIGGKERKRIDEHGVVRLLRMAPEGTILVIEHVGGMPSQSGSAAFVFGYGVGVITAAAIAFKLRVERVHASTWKSAMKCPADKRAARGRASDLLPAYADLWRFQKDDGKAEAAMLLLYGEKVFGAAQ